MLEEIVYAALIFFFIFDPLASMPVFISLTKGETPEQRAHSANMAILVALILLIVFMTIGESLLDLFGISMDGFRIAGGLVLLLMGLEIIFSLKLTRVSEGSVAWVIIATPVLSGPGVITTSILLSASIGFVPTLVAGVVTLGIVWVVFRNASRIMDILGKTAIEVLSRIIGLLLAALGIDYIVSGILDYVNNYPEVGAALLSLANLMT